MSSAEEMEAGKRALARRQGRGITEPGQNRADKFQSAAQMSHSPVPAVSVANGPEPKAPRSINSEPNMASLADGMAKASNAPSGNSATSPTILAHDKDMARRFLAGLDPNATRFTFQLFCDCGDRYAEILHGTLDEVWAKIQVLNTPQRGIGVFVTINETDLKGRTSKNILRGRALFVDADSDEQGESCVEVFTARGAAPSMAVRSGRGTHFYFCTDIPPNQFSALQSSLIAKVGTDAAVKDLPRVMRLPGTLHLKNPAEPRPVKLLNPANCTVCRWKLSDLIAQLGLSPASAPSTLSQSKAVSSNFGLDSFIQPNGERLSELFRLPVESLAEGLRANIDEIRSAVSTIPPSAFSAEPDWMTLARGLAHEAAIDKKNAEQLWEILDSASRAAPGYDEAENRSRFLRYINEAPNSGDPITIATVFHMAREHGWKGWSPPIAATAPGPTAWPITELKVSFSNIPHRRWLYGTYLIRGEVTVLAAPGGAGKTALATGIAVEIATGIEILGEKIFGSDLKTLFINGEDGSTEIERRIWAFYLAHVHKLAGQNLDRLYVAGANDARVQHLSFLRTTERNSMLDLSGFEILGSALEALRPDLLILDPLVAFCGGGNMNDNAVMALVIRELKRLATNFDCAVLIIHHTRKGADDGNAEAISGASATVNLARRAVMPVSMTDKEAEQFHVLPSDRFRYFKLVDAKSNLAPRSADSPWYRLHSVELPNPEPPVYPHGDNVQAVQRVNLRLLQTAPATTDDQKISDAILDLVERGKAIDGQSYPYSPSAAGANNERALLSDAMAAVRDATAPREWSPEDLKAVTVGAIKNMKADGLLVEKELDELLPKRRRFRTGRGLAVVRAAVEARATSGGDTAGEVAIDGGQLFNSRPID